MNKKPVRSSAPRGSLFVSLLRWGLCDQKDFALSLRDRVFYSMKLTAFSQIRILIDIFDGIGYSPSVIF